MPRGKHQNTFVLCMELRNWEINDARNWVVGLIE